MIFLDTNVISETLKPEPESLVVEWLIMHDSELAIPSVTIAELAYGIARIQPEQRAARLEQGLREWRQRFADRIFAFNERAALIYGEIMAEAAFAGRTLSMPDGMIAATALVNSGSLATRNIQDFMHIGIDLINPWSANKVQERP